MDDAERQRWEERYREAAAPPPPCPTLLRASPRLAPAGQALDLACGRGGNALHLAGCGLPTWAWDYSEAAIAALRGAAASAPIPLYPEVRDVIARPPEPERFDVIVVANFLHRPLFAALQAALRPGGLLVYESWCGPYAGRGPQRAEYRLESGELPVAFPTLTLLDYREDTDRAGAILQKP